MAINQLPEDWEQTRLTLQKYSQAVTALPRAGVQIDDRWSHVAMELDGTAFVTVPVPLADGTKLVSRIDLVRHQVVISTGETSYAIDLISGPSPRSVGEAVYSAAASHGSHIDVETERYSDDEHQPYDATHALAFLSVATSVVETFTRMNALFPGEIKGPHLWPHGFDIATEWYSEELVDYDGTPTNPQIATGWYPAGEAYFYSNPWPFDAAWVTVELPVGAKWHTEGWQGAKLAVSDLAEGAGADTVVALGRAVHDAAGRLFTG